MRTLRAQGRAVRRSRPRRVAVHGGRRLDRRCRGCRARDGRRRLPSCTPRRCTSRTSRRIPAQAFVDTNITGTLNLLEAAVARAASRAFLFTSTTSTFGDALVPPPDEPAAWITEYVVPVPKNIYGVTKVAAEDLCELAHRNQDLPCLVLRTSRFFPEADDNPHAARRVRRREPQGERISLSPRRHRGRRRRTSSRARARAGDWLWPLHHQRDDAVHARRLLPSSAAMPPPSSIAASRAGATAMPARLAHGPRSIASTTTRALGRSRLAAAARLRLRVARAERDILASLARAIGIKGYHPVRTR